MSAPPPPARPAPLSLARRCAAEFLGTGLLVAIVVGSGIAASRLSPSDDGLQLLENSLATALGLPVLILLFAPVSGAHLNPVITGADWLLGRHSGTGLRLPEAGAYVLAQSAGAIAGAILANAMFETGQGISHHHRASHGHLLAEVVATAVLVLLVVGLVRSGRSVAVAPAVGAYIGAAYWFTSSTAFANPAVTLGRIVTDSFAGIAPTSAPAFVGAQVAGLAVGLILVHVFYPVPVPPEHTTATRSH